MRLRTAPRKSRTVGAGGLPGGAGGPLWKGRLHGVRHPQRNPPSPAQSRCRTQEQWSPRRHTSWHSFSGVCRWENPAARAHCLRRRWPPPGGRGRAEGGSGATERTPAASLPVRAEEEGWGEAEEVEGDVHTVGERNSSRLQAGSHSLSWGHGRYRHPAASPPQPFARLPFHELRVPLGPSHTPMPGPQLEGSAYKSGEPLTPRGGRGRRVRVLRATLL